MTVTLPSPAEYERMSDDLRRAAADVLRESQAVVNAQRARLGDLAAADGIEQDAVVAEAKALLPEFITTHRDTASLQASRRAALLAAVYPTRRRIG